jgi:uncharacterized protein
MATGEIAGRLRPLPRQLTHGREVAVATGFRSRLLGLALLDRAQAGPGLLIPHCRRVHTFGMRFALDIYFLDGCGEPTTVHRAVPPNRLASDPEAVAVLEVPSRTCPAGGELGSPPT